jgi:hypothetical protein
MRTAGTTAAALLATSLAAQWAASSAVAQTRERFVGTLSCAKSTFAKPARREPVTIEVVGNVASYRHTVLDEDGTEGIGTETGEGAIGKDGRVTLVGAWKSRGGLYSYEARYSGTLDAKGGELTGLQAWIIHGRKAERDCTMTLSKRGRGLLRWRTGERAVEQEGS